MITGGANTAGTKMDEGSSARESNDVMLGKAKPCRTLFDVVDKKRAIFLILLPSLLLFSRVLADITVVLTGVTFLIYSYHNRDWSWTRQHWFLCSCLLVLWLLCTSVFAYKPLVSVGYSLAYLRWPLFALALAFWVLRDREGILLFGLAIAATLSFVIFDSFWQFFNGTDLFGIEKFNPERLTGPLRNPKPGNLTMRLYFIGLFAVICTLYARHLVCKMNVLMMFLAVLLLFEFATGERISFLLSTAAFGIFLVALISSRLPIRKMLFFWLCGSFSLLAIFSLVYPSSFERVILSMAHALTHFEHHHYGIIFNTGLEIWKDHPIAGIGFGNYAEYCDDVMRSGEINNCGRHPHNIYLHWLATSGLVGTSIFILSMILLFYSVLRPLVETRNWLLVAMVGATFFVSFWPLASSSSFFNNWFGGVIWCSLGWAMAVSREKSLWSECTLMGPVGRSDG